MKEALIKGLKSDEWYTPLKTVKTMLEIFPPPKGARVLLPFDTEKSNFTKVITKEYDQSAIYGITDFLTSQYEFDYLISNPPYSNKGDVLRVIAAFIGTFIVSLASFVIADMKR